MLAERWRADNDPNSQAHLGRDPSGSLDPMLSQFGIPAPQGRWGEGWGTRVSGKNKFHPDHFSFINAPFLVGEFSSKHICIRKALKWKNDEGLPWWSSG